MRLESFISVFFQSARERKVPILVDRFAPEQNRPTELQLLQTMWEETSSQKKATVRKLGEQEALHLWEAENPTEEVRQLAVEIRRLVSEENYRYRDIQVLTKKYVLIWKYSSTNLSRNGDSFLYR